MQGYQRSLLIDESPLQVIPALACAIGLNEAIMLQQIHYWSRISEHEREGRRWVPMSARELAEKFAFWSEATIKRTVASLRSRGLLLVGKKSDTSWERANWYAIAYDALNHLNLSIGAFRPNASDQFDPMHRIKVSQSIGSERSDRSGQVDPMSIKGKRTSKKDAGGASPSPVSLAFKAYSEGVKRKYGGTYPPSAKANGQLANVVARVGAEHVVPVVEFYLGSSNPFYARVQHKLDFLVRDCEQLYLQMQRAAGAALPAGAKAEAGLEWEDGRRRKLEDYPVGDAEAIAKEVLRSYSRMGALKSAKNIYVRQGAEQRIFAIRELAA